MIEKHFKYFFSSSSFSEALFKSLKGSTCLFKAFLSNFSFSLRFDNPFYCTTEPDPAQAFEKQELYCIMAKFRIQISEE